MPIDIRYLRDRSLALDTLRESEELRGRGNETVNCAVNYDIVWRQLRAECDALRNQRKLLTKIIRDKIKSNRKDEAKNDIFRSKELGVKVSQLEKEVGEAKLQLDDALMNIGNPLTTTTTSNFVVPTYPTDDNVTRHTRTINSDFIQSLSHHVVSFLKGRSFLPVEPPQQNASIQNIHGGGKVFLAYSSTWVRENVLPLRYVSMNSKELELTVLCHDDLRSTQSLAETVHCILDYMKSYCCSYKVEVINKNNNAHKLPLSAVEKIVFMHTLNGEKKSIIECSNYTDYHSRAVEVRCGHGKGHSTMGSAKRYVHLIHCTISLKQLYACLTSTTMSSMKEEMCDQKDQIIFVPLEIIRTGENKTSAKKMKGEQSKKNSNNGDTKNCGNGSNNSGETKSPSSSFASSSVSRKKKNALINLPIVKLCTNDGIVKLVAILNQQSFLCQPGWVATNEDVVVYKRLKVFLNYINSLEIENVIQLIKNVEELIVFKEKNELLKYSASTNIPISNVNNNYVEWCIQWKSEITSIILKIKKMKDKMIQKKELSLELILKNVCTTIRNACKILKEAGILTKGKHLPASKNTTATLTVSDLKAFKPCTKESLWFMNRNSFWRWYRCLHNMNTVEREHWLPTMEHVQSGRVSMLFDL